MSRGQAHLHHWHKCHASVADAKFVAACSDLTMMSAVNVRDSQEAPGASARASRARLELVRLINLTHVLVCIMADGANKVYARSALQMCGPLPV